MFNDANFKFDMTPKNLAAGTAAQVSTNVNDQGAAKKLFEGYPAKPPKLAGQYKITAGTGALSIRIQLLGADDAALTSNPVTLADSGVLTLDPSDGAALAIGDVFTFALPITGQAIAKRYYGAVYTQGTADQDGEVTSGIVMDAQTWMAFRKAAVP